MLLCVIDWFHRSKSTDTFLQMDSAMLLQQVDSMDKALQRDLSVQKIKVNYEFNTRLYFLFAPILDYQHYHSNKRPPPE